jgi:hypothetical protein
MAMRLTNETVGVGIMLKLNKKIFPHLLELVDVFVLIFCDFFFSIFCA